MLIYELVNGKTITEYSVIDMHMELLREECDINSPHLIENDVIHQELRDFLRKISITPVIGNTYYFRTISWVGMHMHKWMSLAIPADSRQLTNITEERIFLDGKTYPALVNDNLRQTQATMLFETEAARNSAITALQLKFSDWRIVEKVSQ